LFSFVTECRRIRRYREHGGFGYGNSSFMTLRSVLRNPFLLFRFLFGPQDFPIYAQNLFTGSASFS